MKPLDAGEHVFIRRPRRADADEFLRGVAQSRTLHRPWVYPGTSPREFEAYLRRQRTRRYLKVGGRWRDHDRWALRVERWLRKNRTQLARQPVLGQAIL